ncbi:hypothetical protein EV702DRAFT_1117320 [Suillus placidus]|uniref:Uncharacterized protein n=1 Tax=Suillus placidus TaxID=48579 RepID=A0A9P6ZRQ4_9AGAM|nr:hypothetical protein EV702DRAFT_1117320 [Suillus placidus]
MYLCMDPAQNRLIAIGYHTTDHHHHSPDCSESLFYIDLKALDGDSVRPQVAGQTLFLSELRECQGHTLKLQGFGRHIALQRVLRDMWWLQIWDWQHSTTSNVSLAKKNYVVDNTSNSEDEDFYFLGNDGFLITSDKNLNLCSIHPRHPNFWRAS